MRLKKTLTASMSLLMAASMVLTGCSNADQAGENVSTGEASTTSADDVEKPEKITIMCNGGVTTQANNRDAFEARWEELTGIDLEIIQPDHDAYYDVLGQTFASGPENWPDVIMVNPTYYTGYVREGALWDMTDAWENSELKASGRVTDESVIDVMRVDGHLYCMPANRGAGCVTYIKQSWLDNVGMEAPTNYEEYTAMLDAFTKGDPDGNGVNGDTYGVSAAGFMGVEAPYVSYLPEFYQDAYPSFAQDENGVWYDGFTTDSMKAALTRLREAYVNGWIDKESLTNGTSDCRNKFFEDKFGVFTYWAGTWATKLKDNLAANDLPSDLVALPPIEEVGTYIERPGDSWAITAACENPEGVYKYFIETMLDGGEMQMLWTYGVEGVHWSTKAETVCGNTYAEGEFHQLESLENPGTQYVKQHISPLGAIAPLPNDPGTVSIPEEQKKSLEVFSSNSRMDPLVPSTDVLAMYNGDLMTLKNSIVADVVVEGVSIEDAYARFEKEGGAEWSKMIVDSLNNA